MAPASWSLPAFSRRSASRSRMRGSHRLSPKCASRTSMACGANPSVWSPPAPRRPRGCSHGRCSRTRARPAPADGYGRWRRARRSSFRSSEARRRRRRRCAGGRRGWRSRRRTPLPERGHLEVAPRRVGHEDLDPAGRDQEEALPGLALAHDDIAGIRRGAAGPGRRRAARPRRGRGAGGTWPGVARGRAGASDPGSSGTPPETTSGRGGCPRRCPGAGPGRAA